MHLFVWLIELSTSWYYETEGLASVTRQEEGAKFYLIPDTLGFLSNVPKVQTSVDTRALRDSATSSQRSLFTERPEPLITPDTSVTVLSPVLCFEKLARKKMLVQILSL